MGSLNSNLLTLLLVFHLAFIHVLLVPVSAKVFLSIDCGSISSKPYTDKKLIEWVGDSQYIQTGEPRNVAAKDEMYGFDSHVLSTLREFKTRNKNCYSIDIGKSEDKKVLVRAGFNYGNYDNKSKPPTFQLQFNGNIWVQVITELTFNFEEVVYSLKHGNTISICLAQTHDDNIPFISTLEVRSLDSDMYSYVDSDYSLYFMSRVVYGAKTIRFPEDSYDRIWETFGSLNSSDGLVRVRNSSPSIKVDIDDKVPETLFTEAIMTANSSEGGAGMWLSGYVLDPTTPMHFNAYFSEVTSLGSTQKRSFNISVNTSDVNGSRPSFHDYGIVSPPYGSALQVRLNNVTVKSYDYNYEVVLLATNNSTLPPLINALEAYTIGDKLVQGTNSKDVNSLGLLQKSFIQLQDWQGDPCLPSPYTWDWVDCDNDTSSPRITSLYLNDLGLTGTIPDFSAMDALEYIYMKNNSLSQEIPKFLGTLPNLKIFVSGNPNLSINKRSSSSNNKITAAIPIIVFGSAMIQILDYTFGLLL